MEKNWTKICDKYEVSISRTVGLKQRWNADMKAAAANWSSPMFATFPFASQDFDNFDHFDNFGKLETNMVHLKWKMKAAAANWSSPIFATFPFASLAAQDFVSFGKLETNMVHLHNFLKTMWEKDLNCFSSVKQSVNPPIDWKNSLAGFEAPAFRKYAVLCCALALGRFRSPKSGFEH